MVVSEMIEYASKCSNSGNIHPCKILYDNNITLFPSERYYSADTGCATTDDCVPVTIKYGKEKIYFKVSSVTPGKFFRDCCKIFGKGLNESVITYCSERFVTEYKKQFSSGIYELHVDDCFNKIYNSHLQDGNFHSCMNDRLHYRFYENLGTCKAAYLINVHTNKMVARCVIFNEVYDKDGNKYRYAERQYGTNETIKYILINQLLANGYIDIYKTIGAGCRDNTAIRTKTGDKFKGGQLYINCTLSSDSPVAYNDSFIYYSNKFHKASNLRIEGDRNYSLQTTSGHYIE